jgi:glutathione S-transferase
MDLYFSPLACSMATRIALNEAGGVARFIEVDRKTKTTRDGQSFLTVNPLGLVPTLRTDEGEILTENAAILQYVAERYPAAALAPEGLVERARLQQWLSFIATELHRAVFGVLLDPHAPDEVKRYALAKVDARFEVLSTHLAGREFLLDAFSVADAYLVTVLGWTVATPVDLQRWPVLQAYAGRLRKRPSVREAVEVERALYVREQSVT